ncbi:MAG: hypothetical protein LBM98_00380 [Oscillospiraceae bacterium]|jgi:hypothetical protein|nr:hypothetical protein [Oscillospiraceae bacterium]
MRKDERGMIVVETVGAFVLFVMLVISILTLVNIVALQARIHYALTQTAETLSMYNYTLEVTGLADTFVAIEERSERVRIGADTFKTEISNVLDSLSAFDGAGVQENGEALINHGKDVGEAVIKDPKGAMQLVLNYATASAGSELFEALVKPLIGRYLSNGTMSGDKYLKSVGVIGGLSGITLADGFNVLDFAPNDSKLLNVDGDVKLAARYKVAYKFGGEKGLPLPFPELNITQIVKTHAWLNGNGDGYE